MTIDRNFKVGESGIVTIKNMIAAMICDHIEGDRRPDLDQIVIEVERYLAGLSPLYRSGYLWLLRALEKAPLVMGYRHQFSKLGREDQVKVLDAIEKGSNYIQRILFLSLKTAALLMVMDGGSVTMFLRAILRISRSRSALRDPNSTGPLSRFP